MIEIEDGAPRTVVLCPPQTDYEVPTSEPSQPWSLMPVLSSVSMIHTCIYIFIYIYTPTYMHVYIYMYIIYFCIH